MKIAIDLTPLYKRRITGVEIYGIEMYKALMKTGHEIFPIFRKENTLDSNPNAQILGSANRLIVENLLLPREIRKGGYDVVLFPIFPPPFGVYGMCGTKIVPTIHDLTIFRYPDMLTLGAKYYLKPKYRHALKNASLIVTISESVKEELLGYTDLSVVNWGESISSDLQNIHSRINESLLSKWSLTPHKYLISVSTLEPRKNLKYLLGIFAILVKRDPDLKLVLVGRMGWGRDRELERRIRDLGDSLLFTGFVSTDELVNLNHFARAFFLLSFYEGFGRTPLEAIACGCRHVFVSDIPVFHETMGTFAEYLPLDSAARCAELFFKHDFERNNPVKIQLPFFTLEQNVQQKVKQLNNG